MHQIHYILFKELAYALLSIPNVANIDHTLAAVAVWCGGAGWRWWHDQLEGVRAAREEGSDMSLTKQEMSAGNKHFRDNLNSNFPGTIFTSHYS